jgi:hypothetical protein
VVDKEAGSPLPADLHCEIALVVVKLADLLP